MNDDLRSASIPDFPSPADDWFAQSVEKGARRQQRWRLLLRVVLGLIAICVLVGVAIGTYVAVRYVTPKPPHAVVGRWRQAKECLIFEADGSVRHYDKFESATWDAPFNGTFEVVDESTVNLELKSYNPGWQPGRVYSTTRSGTVTVLDSEGPLEWDNVEWHPMPGDPPPPFDWREHPVAISGIAAAIAVAMTIGCRSLGRVRGERVVLAMFAFPIFVIVATYVYVALARR